MQLTLLGTGNPLPNPRRAGPSQHLQLGGSSVLVDCGSGAAHRMVEAGLEPKDLDYILVTHHHSDHTIDLAHVLISGWIMGRTKTVTVVGPEGTREFVRRLLLAFEFDMQVRRFAERIRPEALEVPVREVGHGDCLEGDGWRAQAIEVEHVEVKPSLGFSFEDDHQQIVISGDTAPCPALIAAAAGADVLVHELNGAVPEKDSHTSDVHLTTWEQTINSIHTCAHQVGRIASQAGVPRLILSHLPPHANEAWVHEMIRRDYSGEVIVGEDLLGS